MSDVAAQPVLLFMYLGRFGALGQFTLELAQAAAQNQQLNAQFLLSANNDIAKEASSSAVVMHTLETFARPTPLSLTVRFPRARRKYLELLDDVRPAAVINLMAHVWSPLLMSATQNRGLRTISVVHDAVPHPGDPTARLNRWLMREARSADRVVTLSRSVAHSLTERGVRGQQDIDVLFHPDLRFGATGSARTWQGERPLKILFFGRIMAYKGLDVLVEAISDLRSAGHPIELGVAGSGEIAASTRAGLDRLNAEVINRWIGDDEITPLLARYDAVACAHVEASQSGVAATAFAHAMPVIAMPTGGIVEQVIEGKTGVLAEHVSKDALGEAILRLALAPQYYNAISASLVATASTRAMGEFLQRISQVAMK